MTFCPQVYKTTEDELKHTFLRPNPKTVRFMSDIPPIMETCCSSLLQCDEQKRAELKGDFIEDGIRHCECEKKFAKCLTDAEFASIMSFGKDYFTKTVKCYSVDHPIIKCEQYKCYYQPNTKFNQYPSGHVKEAIRCVEYQLDESKPKIYQTFELPFYYEGFDDYVWLQIEAEHYRDGNRRPE